MTSNCVEAAPCWWLAVWRLLWLPAPLLVDLVGVEAVGRDAREDTLIINRILIACLQCVGHGRCVARSQRAVVNVPNGTMRVHSRWCDETTIDQVPHSPGAGRATALNPGTRDLIGDGRRG